MGKDIITKSALCKSKSWPGLFIIYLYLLKNKYNSNEGKGDGEKNKLKR